MDVRKVTELYFKQNDMTNMMEYGESSGALAFGDMSEIIADCLEELGIKVDYHYAEYYSDGKYTVTVGYKDIEYSEVMKAWWGSEEVADYIENFLERIK